MTSGLQPPRNAELEAAILEAPESADAYLVYGDWLLEHGDPLGELVTVQATLAKLEQRAGHAKEKRGLGKRERALRAEAEARLGPLAAYEHTWSFGFLESLILPRPTANEYESILAAPAARFLRELDIENLPRVASLRGAHPTIACLTRLGVSPALGKLALLSEIDRRVDLGRIPSDLWTRLAAIQELTVKVARFDPGKLALPRLVTLSLATAITNPLLDALEGAECPLLASLQLDSAMEEIDASTAIGAGRLRSLFALWASTRTLRHLGVTDHQAGDELLVLLLATGLVTQLTSLDLSRSAVSDAGGRSILGNASSFEHLSSVNLSENDLSPAMTRTLEQRFELMIDTEDQGARYDSPEE